MTFVLDGSSTCWKVEHRIFKILLDGSRRIRRAAWYAVNSPAWHSECDAVLFTASCSCICFPIEDSLVQMKFLSVKRERTLDIDCLCGVCNDAMTSESVVDFPNYQRNLAPTSQVFLNRINLGSFCNGLFGSNFDDRVLFFSMSLLVSWGFMYVKKEGAQLDIVVRLTAIYKFNVSLF